MYSGNNILLTTNHEAMVGLLGSELVQLRSIDSILIRTYDDTLNTIETDKPQAIIINCQSKDEEPVCLDLIKKIKAATPSPIILIMEEYNHLFLKAAYQVGISDSLSVQNANAEILMRTIWSLQIKEIKQSNKKHEKLLKQIGILDEQTGFYTTKENVRVFNNEFEYLTNQKLDAIFLALEVNKNSKLMPSMENLIESIKKNVRATDVVSHTDNSDRFYILLVNTNLSGAMVVWNRLNQTIGGENILCGFLSEIEGKTFEDINSKVNASLQESVNSPNFLYISKELDKKKPITG